MDLTSRRDFCMKSAQLLLVLVVFAASASAQQFRITLLGTGSPQPRMDRFGPSILIEAGDEKLLFDCGRGATQRIEQRKVAFASVDALFLTHLHSDHVVGIPDLWLTGWVRGRKSPLRLWGPSGTSEMASHLEQAFSFDVHIRRDVDEKLPPQGTMLVAKDIQQGIVYEHAGIKVTAFLVDHPPVEPAFGYRIDFAGHAVVVSGDTRFSENLIEFARGADVIVHEVIDPDSFRAANSWMDQERIRRIIAHHTTPQEAGTIFARVKPKLAVYSHIVPGDAPNLIPLTRKTYSGPVEVGEDLMTVEISDNPVVHRPEH